jgi:hypothetical protein
LHEKRLISINLDAAEVAKEVAQRRRKAMTLKFIVGVTLAALTTMAAPAQAQVLNLSGQYQCVQGCRGPGPAYVTQNGWDLNLVDEIGQPSRAWIDWPGHLWARNWNEGAVYSPDGMTIQFDNGSVWQRFVPQPFLNNRG